MYEIYCLLRDKQGVKDADIVRETGITKSTFSDWKNGRSKPKQEKLQKLADYFGVSLDYLMTGKENDDKNISLNDDFSFLNDAPYKDEILAIAKYLREFEDKNDLEFVKTFVEKMGNK